WVYFIVIRTSACRASSRASTSVAPFRSSPPPRGKPRGITERGFASMTAGSIHPRSELRGIEPSRLKDQRTKGDGAVTSGRGRAHRHHTTKSEVDLANAGRFGGAVGRHQTAGSALVERRAPYHAPFSLGVEPIAAPLPHISSQVMDSEPIGGVAAHL